MKLYFVNGSRSGQFWDLVPPGICIGREEDNDIQLLLPGISRYHAKVEFTGSQWRITDLGSTNGTKVNGKAISGPVILQDGMQISIGEQLIRFDGKGVRSPETKVLKLAQTPLTAADKTPAQKPPVTGLKMTLPQSEDDNPKPSGGSKETSQNDQNRIGTDDIFRKKSSSSAQKDAGSSAKASPGKRIYNLLFVLLVVLLGCGVIFVFVALNTPAKKQNIRKSSAVQNPFLLEYEKKLRRSDNVFRFYVRIEDHSALFKLDDLRHSRHFTKGIGQVDKELLRSLINEIKGTDFMKNSSAPAGKPRNGEDDYRKLTVGYGSQLNTVVCHNVFPSNSFVDIEAALDTFAEGFGLKTIALSEKQMREEADQSFAKAEELFRNYQARPENLRNAILRYQITMDFLEQFEPKPQNWITARRRLAEANKLLATLVKDANFNVNVYYRKKQYAEAIRECDKLLLYLDPEKKSYQKVRSLKITLEKILSNQSKRRAR